MDDVRPALAECTWERYQTEFADRHLLHGVISKWAREKPDHPAMISAETGEQVTYRQFDERSTALALKLVGMGIRRGDFVATMLPLTVDHILLEYACFKSGAIHVPLDLRLKAPEVVRSLGLVQARAFFFLGATPHADYGELGRVVQQECPFVEHFVQCCSPANVIDRATSFATFAAEAAILAQSESTDEQSQLSQRLKSGQATDGAQVIYTTGSTGFPKPALLSHQNITVQNMCLAAGFGLEDSPSMLVNLPPSHVGCQAEQLMTTFFTGNTAVTLDVFDAEKSLRAIDNYYVDCFGQIPAMFNLQFRLPSFAQFDLSSVGRVIYGGQQVSREFVRQLLGHFPKIGTGLGLSEMAGFVTYTGMTSEPDGLEETVGWWAPVTPVTIRCPMNDDGTAGERLPDGEVGEVCFSGPQVFVDYVNNRDAYRKTVTTDGICYTGDLGRVTEVGLKFVGRSKLVIKPKGYQVHPGQIEDHFAELRDHVAACAAVGAPHPVYSETVVLFVERKADVDLTAELLAEHAHGIAAYMRPSHYVVLEPGEFPLNRVAKTDYVVLKQRALNVVAQEP